MEKIIEIYHSLFPKITVADWFYCLLGLMLHCWLKVKHISLKDFKLNVFVHDFLPVWIYSLVCIIICLGTLPYYLSSYSVVDSALIGYTCGSFFRNILKQRAEQIGVPGNPPIDDNPHNHV